MVQEVFDEYKLPAGWSKDVWEKCVSRHITWYTPYDAGWDGCREYGEDLSTDEELKQIGIARVRAERGESEISEETLARRARLIETN